MTAVSEDKLAPENIDFFAAAREDTGVHLLDSGSAYGRHHEEPEIPEDSPVIQFQEFGWGPEPRINTAAFLDEWFEIDRELQAKIHSFAQSDEADGLNVREIGREVMEREGFVLGSSGNAYNTDNDLDQVYIWEIWQPEGGDPFHDPDAVAAVYMHTGCDVRGGYGHPVIARSYDYSYPVPMDNVVAYRTVEGRAANGGPLSHEDLRELEREWSEAYSRWPTGQLNDDLDRVFGFTLNREESTFVARLTSGEIVKILAYAPGPDGEVLI